MSQRSVTRFGFNIGGRNFSFEEARFATGVISHVIPLPAKPGERIGIASEVGLIEFVNGDNILNTSDVFNVYWNDPSDGTPKSRLGLVVDYSEPTVVVYDLNPPGEGDPYPTDDVEVMVVEKREPIQIDTDLEGNLLELITIHSSGEALIDVRDVSTSILSKEFESNEGWFWISDWGYTNPFAGSLISVVRLVSRSETDGVVNIAFHYRSV